MSLELLMKEFTIPALLSYARARVPQNLLGGGLFPERNVNELEFEYAVDQNLYPVSATIQGWDSETPIASRDGAAKIKGELPPIKRKISLDEKLLIQLKRGSAGAVDILKNKIFADVDNMVASIQTRIERMRMDALANGVLTINENGVISTVDYGLPANHQVALDNADKATGFWSFAKAEPVTQILAWVDIVVATCGIRPIRALTSSTVVANLIRNAQVRTMIYGDNGGSRAVSLNMLNELMATLNLPQIGVYDAMYRAENAAGVLSNARFFPANKFVLLPSEPVGETLIGPTAESLLQKEVDAQEISGIFVTVTQENDPPKIWTKASATAFPTLPMRDAIFQAQVLA